MIRHHIYLLAAFAMTGCMMPPDQYARQQCEPVLMTQCDAGPDYQNCTRWVAQRYDACTQFYYSQNMQARANMAQSLNQIPGNLTPPAAQHSTLRVPWTVTGPDGQSVTCSDNGRVVTCR